MALKDVWIPQNETMDASPEIPNMLANAIIQNETDIKELQENGGSGGSELFVIQWDGKKGDKSYDEILDAVTQCKVIMLYEGNRYLATLSTVEDNDNALVFAAHNVGNMTEVIEYICMPSNQWIYVSFQFVSKETISSDDPDFKAAVLNCFPDADTMSFPLPKTVSEVSEE